jgi:hypothetical protein
LCVDRGEQEVCSERGTSLRFVTPQIPEMASLDLEYRGTVGDGGIGNQRGTGLRDDIAER